MIDIFKDIILENQLEEIDKFFPREKEYKIIPNKALVIIGIRRCGKTTFLKQIYEDLKKREKSEKGSLIYINFSDERLLPLSSDKLGFLLEAHNQLFPNLPESKIVHFFLDEIQSVTGWELFIDRLMRNKQRRIYLTGSSSKLLSKEIATSMRGRSLSYELFPFSFLEILKWENIDYETLSPKNRGIIASRFKKYLSEGGFPEVIPQPKYIQRKILQEYYNVLLYRDVIDRYNPSNPHAVSYLLKLLVNQVGTQYTINKLTHKCKGVGIKIEKNDVGEFINWFNDCYMLFSVPIFAESVSRQTINPKKIYCIDNGLASAVSVGISKNIGHLLENVVFSELRRKYEKIFYFKDRYQHEVDFVVENESGTLSLFQVTESLKSEDVSKREIMSLRKGMSELGTKVATILTLEETDEHKYPEGLIKIIPVWKFLLSLGN